MSIFSTLHSSPTGRFAPTPTGDLHLGNVSTAFLAHLDAYHHQHEMLLRIDDIELRPTTSAYIHSQVQDLNWMGLHYAQPYFRQSQRTPLYQQALEILNQKALLYPCYCSRKEVALFAPHAQDEGHVYPRICRPKDPQVLQLDDLPHQKGRAPTLRLNLQHAQVLLPHLAPSLKSSHSKRFTFQDECQGQQTFDLEHDVGDFLIQRRDGLHAYQLTCAVDDALLGCKRVIRGSDLLISTVRQLLILHLLDLDPQSIPQYAHVGLMVDAQGNRLSKRDQSLKLSFLREHGIQPTQIRSALSQMWWGISLSSWEEYVHAFKSKGLPKKTLVWDGLESIN